MNIKYYYNAAVGATYDRFYVTKLTKKYKKGLLDASDISYLNTLKSESGPSVHNPVKVAKSWVKAYKQNVILQKNIMELMAPFKRSFIKRLLKRL